MAKKNKQRNAPVSYFNETPAPEVWYPVPVPERMSMDDIAMLTDKELEQKSYSLHADRNKVLDKGIDTKLWDVELLYIQREFQMRRVRRDHHERYEREQARLFAEEEARLPSADFDNYNLRFMVS